MPARKMAKPTSTKGTPPMGPNSANMGLAMRAAPHHQGNAPAAMVAIPKATRPTGTIIAPSIMTWAEKVELNVYIGPLMPARTSATPPATVSDANVAMSL